MNAKSEQADRDAALRMLGEMIKDIHVAMLTTQCADRTLRARPMETVPTTFDGDLWFFTKLHAPKVDQVEKNPHVNLSYSDPEHNRYVSISGTASIVRDAKRAELLWSPRYRQWIPEGLDDPELGLLKINVEQAEYWHAPTSTMVQIGGFLQGMVGTARSRKKEHETIVWPRPAVPVQPEQNDFNE